MVMTTQLVQKVTTITEELELDLEMTLKANLFLTLIRRMLLRTSSMNKLLTITQVMIKVEIKIRFGRMPLAMMNIMFMIHKGLKSSILVQALELEMEMTLKANLFLTLTRRMLLRTSSVNKLLTITQVMIKVEFKLLKVSNALISPILILQQEQVKE